MSDARVELQSWYLRQLWPKLDHAARTGAVDAHAAVALDVQIRRLLAVDRPREHAA
jgi:hypothetical protein